MSRSYLSAEQRKQVAESLSKVVAETYMVYLKTHGAHWNVEGPYFQSLHILFEGQYTELWNAIDVVAERVRTLGEYVPASYGQFVKLSHVKETEEVLDAMGMVRDLLQGHETLIETLASALKSAQEAGDETSAGLLTSRLEAHEKHAWMLRATLK